MIFVDTSALLAILDNGEGRHRKAVQMWQDLVRRDATLHTTSYVLLEAVSLVQRRLGLHALRVLHDEITPILTIDWISEEAHRLGVEAALIAGRRGLSAVDCISFRSMRQHHIDIAFCFDAHFREQGFTVLPELTSSE